VRLAGDGGNVVELGVIVKDDRTVVLGDGCSDQVDDTGRSVVPAGGHPNLDIPRPLGDHLGDRQYGVEIPASLSDQATSASSRPE
jgi:hypothetical protein